MLKLLIKRLFLGEAGKSGISNLANTAEYYSEFTNTANLSLQFGDQTLKRCKYGWMLFSGPFIGKCLELYGEYSESEVEIFRHYIRPGDVVIDIGANIGDLTLPLSLLAGDTGSVYAYESNPITFNTLCANLSLNQILNVKPINALVSNGGEISIGDSNFGAHAYIGDTWAPNIASIDQLDINRLRFIKIDIEGNELEALKSGINHIKKHRPILYFENDRKDKSKDLLEFVFNLGYKIYFHYAPIFNEKNYLNNPMNYWAPNNFISLMMLALPPDIKPPHEDMPEVQSKDDWWKDTL